MDRAQSQTLQLVKELELVSAKSTDVDDADVLHTLRELTTRLIDAMRTEGRQLNHPYARILNRQSPISAQVHDYIRGRRVLVTGGAGTIGSRLAKAVLDYGPSSVVALDTDAAGLTNLAQREERIEIAHCNIEDADALGEFWKQARPEVVFHVAAERDPRAAQNALRRSIRTNILGTYNVAQLAADNRSETFVHASTGKCRLLFDRRVYPSTKQLAEVIVRDAARQLSDCRWSCVRFHHIVDNSLVEARFREQVGRDLPLTVHLPMDRKKHGQNAAEAVAMLLNAGVDGINGAVFASDRQSDDFSILELALHVIANSSTGGAIAFEKAKVEEGYLADEFPGNRRPVHADRERLTHGYHTIETDLESIVHLPPRHLVFDHPTLPDEVGEALCDLLTAARGPSGPDDGLVKLLDATLWNVAQTTYAYAPQQRLLDCLEYAKSAARGAKDFGQQFSDNLLLLRYGLERSNAGEARDDGIRWLNRTLGSR